MVAEGHGLGGLQMGEAGHHGVSVLLGLVYQHRLQFLQSLIEGLKTLAHMQLEVCCHLVVARPGGVQAACSRAHKVAQTRFHVHVDVFEVAAEREGAVHEFLFHLVQPVEDFGQVVACDNAAVGQHLSVGTAAGNVLPGQALIEVDGNVDCFHDGVRSVREPAAPHFVAHSLCLCRCLSCQENVSDVP